jgi:hypothetical protein
MGYFDDIQPEPRARSGIFDDIPAIGAKKGYFEDLVPEGAKLSSRTDQRSEAPLAASPDERSAMDKLLGIGGPRYQLFPERLVRGVIEGAVSGATLPHDVMTGEASPNDTGRVLDLAGLGIMPTGGGARGAAIGPLAPKNVRNVAGVDVPLSLGQETGNVTQQIMENAALRGARGNPAQQVAERFFTGQQQPANEAARAAVGRNLDPFGQAVAENPQEAGELVGSSVRDIASTQKQGYKSLYDEAMGLPGEFHASAFEGIGQRIKGDLSLGKSPVIIDDVTTPVANRAIQDIDNNISRLKIQNRADPFGQPNPQNITGINLAGVDQTRKRLTAMASATDPGSADRRAMSRIISSFDDHIEGAISDGLFTGDDRALDAIREARSAYSQYRKTFSSQGAGDDVGRVMEKIIGRNGGEGATPTEIANYLYGNAKVGGSGTSVRLAQRLQGVLGPQSPEWSAVRQGLWSRLTEATEGTAAFGPQRISNRVGEFLNGSGKPLAQMMFTAGERSQMQRYAKLQQQLTPKPGTVNYSNTGVLMSALKASANSILTFLGAHLGGPVGAVAGAAVGPIGSRIKENMAAGALSRSLYQKPPRVGAPVRFGRGAVRNTVLSLSPAPQNQQ